MNKKILQLAIPNIITNITVPLLGIVDTAIVGHLESELYIGAIAVATMIFNFIYWNFSFLRMGTSGFTAQAYGAGDQQETVNILLRSLTVALSIGLFIILFQYLILRIAFLFVDSGEEIKQYVSTYFFIYIWAAPAILSMYALSGWFIGMQNAKTPMYISIATNLTNISLSLLFVYGFNLQLKGVALGSVLSQWMAFLVSVWIWNKKYISLKPYISKNFIKKIADFKPFFLVNKDIFLRSLALVFVTTFFTSASTKQGETILSVNSLLMQLFILFSYMMDGFAYAAEALTGRYVGAQDTKNLHLLIRRLFFWGISLTLLFTAFYILFTNDILHLFTDKENIVQAATHYQYWAFIFPIAGFAAFLWDGIFIGMTASKQMRNSMFIAVATFFICYYLLVPIWGNNGLWLSFILYLSMRGIVQTCMFPSIQRSGTY